jgi:hypothetical protein
MLLSTVVLPDSFALDHFDNDPSYYKDMKVFLEGINTNGLIIVDADNRLYEQICDRVESLARHGKGKAIHVLFEELLKKHRQKSTRFVKSDCSLGKIPNLCEVVTTVASACKADALLADSIIQQQLGPTIGGGVPVVSISDYIFSQLEAERRRCVEALPCFDEMKDGEFETHIVRATRFSRWIRFYDKQIGKGKSLPRFRRGIEKVLQLWLDHAYFYGGPHLLGA